MALAQVASAHGGIGQDCDLLGLNLQDPTRDENRLFIAAVEHPNFTGTQARDEGSVAR